MNNVQVNRLSATLFLLILIVFVQCTFGQTIKHESVQSFIPKGFELLDSASGDFNKDGYKDLVLVLNNKKTGVRPLLILMGKSNGQLTLIARNDSIVLCEACGGSCCDPYNDLVTKKEYFSVEQYGGENNTRWTRVITFKLDKTLNQFILHKDVTIFTNASEDPKTAKYKTNHKENFDKLSFSKYSNE